MEAIRARVAADAMLRKNVFWAELTFTDEVDPTDDAQHRLINVVNSMRGSLASDPTDADRSWLVEALADEGKPERRAVALHALIDIWQWNRRGDADLDVIRASLKGDAALGRVLDRRTAAAERDEEMERIKRDRERAEAEREDEWLKDWKEWRDALMADPADAFSAAKVETTLCNLCRWLHSARKLPGHYGDGIKDELKYVFGADVARRAEDASRARWRDTRPEEELKQPAEERILGLLGIFVEAATPGWAENLSPRDATTAAN